MIAREQLAQLAELYDQYQNSLHPLSVERAEAGRLFKERLADLHATHAADIPFDHFVVRSSSDAASFCERIKRREAFGMTTRYDLAIARKGWLEKGEVINTLPLKPLVKELNRKRS